MDREFYNWQQAIMAADKETLPPLTRLVLFVIGSHMNKHGGGSFPSYSTIAQESALARNTVREHVDIAVKAGFLIKTNRSARDGRCTSNEYQIALPNGIGIQNPYAAGATGLCRDDGMDQSPGRQGYAAVAAHHYIELPKLTNTPLNPPKGKQPLSALPSEARLFDFSENQENISCADSGAAPADGGRQARAARQKEWFAEFWELYPRKRGKPQAERAFCSKITSQAKFNQIMAGLRRELPEILSREEQYRKHPQGWINAMDWALEPTEQTKPTPAESEFDRLAREIRAEAARGIKKPWE